MGRRTETPRYVVLSGRFSDEENEWFRQKAKEAGKPISALVREILTEWRERCAAKNAEG